MRPFVSASSLYSFTAHCRQAPTECSAGCQQKYGRFRPEGQAHVEEVLALRVHLVPPAVYGQCEGLHFQGHLF